MMGEKLWIIPGGLIPSLSHGPEPECTSRDVIAVLNTNDSDVKLEIWIYYEHSTPIGPHEIFVEARRCRKIWLNNLIEPEAIPLNIPYSIEVRANQPVVIQFTRQDTSFSERTQTGTIAYAE